MKLYYFPVAPNPTRVRLYLAEKAEGGAAIPMDMELVNLREREQKSPEFLAKNPLGKLPVLELCDGSFVTESLPIIEYFEELHPSPPMIGETPEERLRVRSTERLADLGALIPVAGLVHATRSPLGLTPDAHAAELCRERLEPGLAELESRLARDEFVAGHRVSIADCTLFAAATFGGFFGVDICEGRPNITRWRGMYAARPAATLP